MIVADILITPLQRVETQGGDVLHGLKHGDVGYTGFGEVYFSWIAEGAVKAWKRHTKMTMNLIVPVGKVRFVFCRINASAVEEFRAENVGEDRYVRISVPPGTIFGFQGLGSGQSLVTNIASIPHDPKEAERILLSDINYEWGTTE